MAEASHQWLFPRCSCVVHHGGLGTTQAALRAGVPSVITPVFGDQFHNAPRSHRARMELKRKEKTWKNEVPWPFFRCF